MPNPRPLSWEELEHLRERHAESERLSWCHECDSAYPCDAAALLDHIALLEAELVQAGRALRGIADMNDALESGLSANRPEVAMRHAAKAALAALSLPLMAERLEAGNADAHNHARYNADE